MKRLIKLGITVVAAAMMFGATAGTVAVTSATAQQRYPWNGLVDITVTIQAGSNDVVDTVCTFVATNCATKDAIPIEHITRNGEDTGTGNIWTRKYIWDATADAGAVKIGDVALSIDAFVGVQLWEDGPCWATCNVGATKPEECGYYFMWGDTAGYKREGSSWNAVDGTRTGFTFNVFNCQTYKSSSQLKAEGYIDSTCNLVAKYDAAIAHLGMPWRMPTDAEFETLVSKCTATWTNNWNGTGVTGLFVTGKGAYLTKRIFLPAAGAGDGSGLNYLGSSGNYWSSTLASNTSAYARYLYFSSGNFRGGSDMHYYGQSVRAVLGFAK